MDGQSSWIETLARGDEVHVWYVLPDSIDDDRLLARYTDLMSPTERERNGRFKFPRGRREHLVTRALARTTLSRYHPAVDPRAWQFRTNRFGRPEVASPLCEPRIRFNLSHTDGLIACLVAVDRAVGIDVEDTTRPQIGGVEIAEHYFSPTEVAALRSLPQAAQHDRFFDYWTLKEAYIKARGLGLQIPLDQFSFHLEENLPITISFGPGITDDPRRWQFELHSLPPRHRLAVAVHRADEPDLTVRLMAVVPFASPNSPTP